VTKRNRDTSPSQTFVKPIRPKTICCDRIGCGDVENNKKEIMTSINEDDLQEDGVEAVVPKCAKDPGEPTSEERERHSKTHLPFRSWCRKCVMGRGRDNPHTHKKDRTEQGIPIIGVDFYFIGTLGWRSSCLQWL
jgi:hypothetical protein